jgi:hypothetical protein
MPMPALPQVLIDRSNKMFREGVRLQDIADELHIGIGTVSKYATDEDRRARAETIASLRLGAIESTEIAPSLTPVRMPDDSPSELPPAKHEQAHPAAPAPELPEPFPQSYEPFVIDTPGVWLLLMDCHIPYFDRGTIELAVEAARKRGAVGVLLNGDILDAHEVSDFDKDPTAPRYVEEIGMGKQFIAWLKSKLPRARVVYKEGNHEVRATRYIIRRAPALFGLSAVTLPSLLELDKHGVEWVGDSRVVQLGKLNVIHGHEYPGGASSPVNPARGLYLKARSVALCGHHHRTSEHHAKDIRGHPEAAWSVGCSCFLRPRYAPLAEWNLGYALVELSANGDFVVENRRVDGGRVW